LNQEDDPIKFWLSYQEDDIDSPSPTRKQDSSPERKNPYTKTLSYLQNELSNCVNLIQEYERNKSSNSTMPFFQTQTWETEGSFLGTTRRSMFVGGPSFMADQCEKKRGDDSPSEEDNPVVRARDRLFSFSNRSIFVIHEIGELNNTKFLDKTDLIIQDLQRKLNNIIDYTKSLTEADESSPSWSNFSSPFDFGYSKNRHSQNYKYQNTTLKTDTGGSNTKSNGFSLHLEPILNTIDTNKNGYHLRDDGSYDYSGQRQFSNQGSPSRSPTLRRDIPSYMLIEENNLKASKEEYETNQKEVPHISSRLKVKKNISVFFGHENWNIVLNMMIGIRASTKSVYRIRHAEENTLNDNDFKLKVVFELVQQRTTNLDLSQLACRFTEYAPLIFDEIRRRNGIDSETFLRSVGPENLLVICVRF